MEMVEQFLFSKVYLMGKEWRCNLKVEALHLIVVVQMAERYYDEVFVYFLHRSYCMDLDFLLLDH